MVNKTNSLNLRVEQFEYFKLDNHLSKFDISQNMVIYFDLENSHIIDDYIQVHFDTLSQRFKGIDLEFINLSTIDYSKDLEDILKYYIPFLSDIEQEQFRFTKDSILPEDKIIVHYLGYEGTIKKGFVLFKEQSAFVIGYNKCEIQSIYEEYFDSLFQFIKGQKREEEYDDLPCSPFNPYENLDENTLAKINEIQNQLYELKQNGQLLFVLPILKQILRNEVNNSTKSNLIVDKDYRILLPNFNNLEIQLSHLTKAVYILFYNNPQGINIKQLHLYKKQLLELYSNISYQIDYDKIQQSVEDLVKPEGKGIYTHLARIKSAFCKQMDFEFAKNYIITGSTFGSDMKYIPILKETHSQNLQNVNSLSSGITKPLTDDGVSELFNINEFDD